MKADISIIVPIYNTAKYLPRCLDSLIQQTLQSIEIILVDDGSIDDSFTIASDYQKKYPELITLHKNTGKGAAAARNLGIHVATTEYITFVDSDDYIDLWALKEMYNTAKTHDADIVCAPYYEIKGTSKVIRGKMKNVSNYKRQDILLTVLPNFWNKLFRTSTIRKYGDIPLLHRGEDTAFVYPLLSWAGKVVCIDEPYYYYEVTTDSISSKDEDESFLENIIAVNQQLSKGNPKYYRELRYLSVTRLLSYMIQQWSLQDVFIAYLKNNITEYYYHPNFACSPSRKKEVERYLSLPDEPFPCKVYINGFGGIDPDLANKKYRNAFRSGQVEILNETNCDLTENILVYEAFVNKEYRFVGEYFAIKRIYEFGGIYLSNAVVVTKGFNYMRYNNAFFGYEAVGKISGDVFGGASGVAIFKTILDSYRLDNLFEEKYISVSSRIQMVLIGMYNIQLTGTLFYDDEINLRIYDPTMMAFPLEKFKNACYIDYSKHQDGGMAFLSGVFQTLVNNATYNKNTTIYWGKSTNDLEQQMREIINSEAFKVGKLLMRLLSPVKKVSKKIIKIMKR